MLDEPIAELVKVLTYHVLAVIDEVSQAAACKNFVELAASVSELSTLVAAVSAAGRVATLSGAGPFTVFAPTDAAFALLDEEVLASSSESHPLCGCLLWLYYANLWQRGRCKSSAACAGS